MQAHKQNAHNYYPCLDLALIQTRSRHRNKYTKYCVLHTVLHIVWDFSVPSHLLPSSPISLLPLQLRVWICIQIHVCFCLFRSAGSAMLSCLPCLHVSGCFFLCVYVCVYVCVCVCVKHRNTGYVGTEEMHIHSISQKWW